MKPGIIILAAGDSSRMGTPKQLLMYAGETLLQRTIHTAQAVAETVVVVLGAEASTLVRACNPSAGDTYSTIQNNNWREGMGTSVSLGLRTLLDAHPDTHAAIFLLCDQPLVTSDILQQIIALHETTGSPIVAAAYNGTLGVPALFDSSLFPALLALNGTDGARKIIQQHRSYALGVPFPAGAIDIDTPADYARLVDISLSQNPIPA